ncbi:MAG: phosphate ABC transporter permease PstA [Spirochaetales bacterium]|nr:phosphate ABC transporter permease PstA [Spirochaetales bacterium]
MDNISSHTKRSLFYEKVWKGVVWISAGITIGFLFWILGYIFYKGLVSDTRTEYPFIGKAIAESALDENANSIIVVIVHPDIRIKELTIKDIIDYYRGEERFWLVSEQGLKVRPFSYNPSLPLGVAFRDAVIGADGSYVRSTVFVESDEQMIRMVSSTRGGIGYLNSSGLRSIKNTRGVKTVKIRTLSLFANEDVFAIRNNMKLTSLTEEDVRRIYRSKVRNWKEVGGIDLPIVPVCFSSGTVTGRQFTETVLDGNEAGPAVRRVSSLVEMTAAVGEHPGAVGVSPYLLVKDDLRPRIIKVERREIKQNISIHFLLEDPEKAGKAGGIASIIINTMILILLTLFIAAPIGVGAALYLTEYSKQGKIVAILRFFTETLAGIPSIIFGLFGYIVFVIVCKMGMGLLSGTLTITIMILPTIIRTSEEAFKAVPKSYREESLALGATLWQTVHGVVLPTAIPGILTGIILAIGRTVGETAAVLFTLGSRPGLFQDIFSSGRVLSLHLYILAKEGISFERAFATALILIVIILLVNIATTTLIGRMSLLKKR